MPFPHYILLLAVSSRVSKYTGCVLCDVHIDLPGLLLIEDVRKPRKDGSDFEKH